MIGRWLMSNEFRDAKMLGSLPYRRNVWIPMFAISAFHPPRSNQVSFALFKSNQTRLYLSTQLRWINLNWSTGSSNNNSIKNPKLLKIHEINKNKIHLDVRRGVSLSTQTEFIITSSLSLVFTCRRRFCLSTRVIKSYLIRTTFLL